MQVSPLRHLRSNAVAYLALFVALGGTSLAAATVITGKNVKNSSLTGKDVKNSSLTGADVRAESLNGGDVADGSLLGQDFAPGQLPQGPKGDKGAPGQDGTDASVNGVAAGGDLAGTYPNPTLKAGAVGVGALSTNLQQGFVLQDDDRTTDAFTPGPAVDGMAVTMGCSTATEQLRLVNSSGVAGSYAVSLVRGSGTAFHDQQFLANSSDVVVFDTATLAGSANDRGAGLLLFWGSDGRVWTLDFNYDATDSYCSLQGVLRRG